VTDYYSKPTESMVAEASDLFLSRVAARIDVSEAVLRSPDELQRLYESARGKAGTLADFICGQCVSHGYCAAKFACVGCACKVPEPAKRYQIESRGTSSGPCSRLLMRWKKGSTRRLSG